MSAMTHRQKQAGFTIVELLITVTILGILLATGIPAMSTWMANARIRATAESIANGMQLARSEAIRRNVNIEFRLTDAQGSWTVSSGSVCSFTTPTVIQSTPSANPTIVVNTFSNVLANVASNAPVRIFGPNGWQSCTTNIPQFVALTIDNTSLSNADSRDLRIVIPTVGRPRVCDPYAGIASSDPRFCPTS